MRSKYGNIKTNGFDSKKESKRMQELKLLERSGKIKDLCFQVSFILLEKIKIDGKIQREIKYIADFTYFIGGKYIVEDTKGFRTDVYKIKKKLFRAKYPHIEFRET